MKKPNTPIPDPLAVNPRHEVSGCPTGLANGIDPPIDTVDVRGPLGVEKLEGRQEGGRDEQDEAEEDEPDLD